MWSARIQPNQSTYLSETNETRYSRIENGLRFFAKDLWAVCIQLWLKNRWLRLGWQFAMNRYRCATNQALAIHSGAYFAASGSITMKIQWAGVALQSERRQRWQQTRASQAVAVPEFHVNGFQPPMCQIYQILICAKFYEAITNLTIQTRKHVPKNRYRPKSVRFVLLRGFPSFHLVFSIGFPYAIT